MQCTRCITRETELGEMGNHRRFVFTDLPGELVPSIAFCLGAVAFATSSQLCVAWRRALHTAVERIAHTDIPTEGFWGFLRLQERCTGLLLDLRLASREEARDRTAPGIVAFQCCRISGTELSSSNATSGRRPLPEWVDCMPMNRPPALCQLSPACETEIDCTAFLRAVRDRCAPAPCVGLRLSSLAHVLRAFAERLHFSRSISSTSWSGEGGIVAHLSEVIWSVLHILQDSSFCPRAVELASIVEHVLSVENAEALQVSIGKASPRCCTM